MPSVVETTVIHKLNMIYNPKYFKCCFEDFFLGISVTFHEFYFKDLWPPGTPGKVLRGLQSQRQVE